MKELLQEINNVIHIHDSGVLLSFKEAEEQGIHLEVSYTNIDKIIGIEEITKIINKHLKKYGLKISSIGLKK